MDISRSPSGFTAMANEQLQEVFSQGVRLNTIAGYPQPFQRVPTNYMEELQKHVNLYPNDTNFRVVLTPGKAYGFIVCLENGCDFAKVALSPSYKSRYGGIAEGFGSLSAYREHIAQHPTHAHERHARVKAEEQAKNGLNNNAPKPDVARIKQEPNERPNLLDQLDAILVPSSNVKSEPSESRLYRKRQSTEPLLEENGDRSAGLSEDSSHYLKKPKLEVHKTPLGPADLNTRPFVFVPPATTSSEEVRFKIKEVQSEISNVQTMLDRIRRLPKPSKRDIQNENAYVAKILDLKRRKEKLKASIPAAVPIPQNTPHAQTFKLSFDWSPKKSEPVASGSGFKLKNEPEYDALGGQRLANGVKNEPMKYDPSATAMPGTSGSIPSSSDLKTSAHGLWQPDIDPDEDDYSDDEGEAFPDVRQRLAGFMPVMGPIRDPYDENGNFHGRGRDTWVGPQAKADDISKFLTAAGNAELFDGNASVDKALLKLGLTAQRQLLPGMDVALMPHQTIGVAWMLDRERDNAFNGGCLSDEMGLGKTIQMIAVMVLNRSDDPRCKTNLILAPVSLLDQWKLEIELKANIGLKCHVHHGSGKLKRKSDILKYDVILTTYQTMALEWVDYEKGEKLKARRKKKDDFIETDSEAETWRKKSKNGPGPLFDVEWYRVILDEAHIVRNKGTRASRAVTELQTTYRWCLTGTPIINSLGDTYSLLRFLKVRPWYDWQEFYHHISKYERTDPSLAALRLQAILSACNIRRMKTSKLDGKNLIELPPKDVQLLKLEFSVEERELYDMVEKNLQERFNRFRKAGVVLKNYHQVLLMLLRLRQICCHPALIQEGGLAFVSSDEWEEQDYEPVEFSAELSRARRLVSQEFVNTMKERLKHAALARMAAEKESEDAMIEDAGGDECPICFDMFTEAVVTPCTHCFCLECLLNYINNHRQEDVNERPCPVCRAPLTMNKWFSRSAFEPTEAELKSADGIRRDSPDNEVDDSGDDFPAVSALIDISAKGKGKKKSVRTQHRDVEEDDDDDLSDFIVESDEDEEEKDYRKAMKKRIRKRNAVVDSDDDVDAESIICGKKPANITLEEIKLLPKFLPSTKMKFMMESIHKCAVDHPDEKILVISQWTQCLALVSNYLTEQGVLHVIYHGKLNRVGRDRAIRVFVAKNKATVMLMSLKCGGVGLNLSRANRVISLDLAWSSAVENQAFDRVHRLGQERPVTVQKLVIANTVEDRIMEIQDRKQKLADGSLGEGNGKKIGRLSVRELAALFGLREQE